MIRRLLCSSITTATLMFYTCLAHTSDATTSYSIDDGSSVWGPRPEFFHRAAKSNVDRVFKVAGHYDLAEHWHTSPEQMTLLSGELDINDQGQSATRLNNSMYAYVPAKAPHHGRCIIEAACVLFVASGDPLDTVRRAT